MPTASVITYPLLIAENLVKFIRPSTQSWRKSIVPLAVSAIEGRRTRGFRDESKPHQRTTPGDWFRCGSRRHGSPHSLERVLPLTRRPRLGILVAHCSQRRDAAMLQILMVRSEPSAYRYLQQLYSLVRIGTPQPRPSPFLHFAAVLVTPLAHLGCT